MFVKYGSYRPFSAYTRKCTIDHACMYCWRALPDRTAPFQRASSICRMSENGIVFSCSTDARTWSTTVGLAWPTTTERPSTTDSPKNSASPSLSQGGSSLPKKACAYWWKPSCCTTCATRWRGRFSTKNASPEPRGVMKNMPPDPVAFTPNCVRSVSR